MIVAYDFHKSWSSDLCLRPSSVCYVFWFNDIQLEKPRYVWFHFLLRRCPQSFEVQRDLDERIPLTRCLINMRHGLIGIVGPVSCFQLV